MDEILMLRKEGHVGGRGIYIGMRRQASELGLIRYAHAGSARDSIYLVLKLIKLSRYYIIYIAQGSTAKKLRYEFNFW